MSTTPPPPPPPEDPFPNFSSGENTDPFATTDAAPIDEGRPSVATSPGRVKVVLGVIGLVLLFLLYNIFSGGDEDKVVEQKPVPAVVAPASVTPPPLPPIEEELPQPPPNLIPPAIPEPTNVNALIRPEDEAAEKERIKQRMRSGMLVANNSSGGSTLDNALGGNEEQPTTDPNLSFASGVSRANTKANRVQATRIGNLHRTIAQGRLIQATMESVINTELPAPVRAIVSRDVFGEAGKTALIPKGSRLIGVYNTALLGGQSRAYLIWTRVIRPDGVDVMIDSPLVDALGQAGVGGQVDSKFQQTFSRAVMSSVIAIALAIGSDEITGGGQVSNAQGVNGSVQSGDGATTATVNALNRLGSTTDSFMQRYLNLQPSILVDQGTKVNVFVNRDLVFPTSAGGTQVIE